MFITLAWVELVRSEIVSLLCTFTSQCPLLISLISLRTCTFLLSSKTEVFSPLSLILIFLTAGASLLFLQKSIRCAIVSISGIKHLVCLFSLNPCICMNKLSVFQVPLWSFCAFFCLFVVSCLVIFSILQCVRLRGAHVPPFLSICLWSVDEYVYFHPHSSIPFAT